MPSVKVMHYRSSSRVSSLFVERSKTAGFVRYFRKHFSGRSNIILKLFVFAGIYTRHYARCGKSLLAGLRKGRSNLSAIKQQRRLKVLAEPITPQEKKLGKFAPVLLAGSSGQVGVNILHHLLGNNLETFAMFHSHIMEYEHPKLRYVQGALAVNNPEVIAAKPKTLLHTPALWLLPPQVPAFAALGVKRIIAFSTTSIMGKASSRNPYEQQSIKRLIQAEKDLASACEAHGIGWTIIRPTLIYGCGLDHNVSSIVRFSERFKFFPIATPGKGLRAPVHVDDLATAVMQCLATPETCGKIYNLSGGEKLTYREMVKRIFHTLGRGDATLPLPGLPLALDVFSRLTGRRDTNGEIARRMNADLVFDIHPAIEDFGYKPRGFLRDGKKDLGL